MWDVAARYAGEHHGFKLAVAAAYNEIDSALAAPLFAPGGIGVEAEYFQIGAYVQHVATGLFLYGAYGNNELNFDNTPGVAYEADTFYIKGGLRTKFNQLGATVFYAEYENVEGDLALAGAPVTLAAEEMDLWGLGVVQEVDAAAMSVWIKYRNMSYDVSVFGTPVPGFLDMDYVGVGGLINF